MQNIVKENNLKIRSYSFYESLYEKFHWIKPIKHKCFNKEYETHPLIEPSPQRGILKNTEIQVFENVLTQIVRIKYYNTFYETKKIEGHRQNPVKREQMRIDNQKQLEQVL